MLSITKKLKEFRNMLLGQRLRIHTGHMNLMHLMTTYSSKQNLRQRLLIEKIDTELIYVYG